MKQAQRHIAASLTLAASFLGVAAFDARADAIIDWSVQSDALIAQSGLGTPPAIRAMALVQTAALDAVNTLEQRREDGAPEATELRNARLEAAVAAGASVFSLHPLQTIPDAEADLAGAPCAVAAQDPGARDAAAANGAPSGR